MMEQGCLLFRHRQHGLLGGQLLLLCRRTNGIQGFLVVVSVLLLRIPCRWLCFVVASHAPSACASAPARGLAGSLMWGAFMSG